MIRLLLIRHGATAGNLEKRYIGRTDEPLCGVGIAQAEALRREGLRADALFVSPMLRARQTAERVFPQMPVTVVRALREMDFGIFEGKTAAELEKCPEYRAWVDAMCRGPIPGGEGMTAFKARCLAGFEELLQDLPEDSCAAFVVHGGVIMAVLEALARPKQDFYAYHIGNGAYIRAVYDCRSGLLVTEPSDGS